MPAVIVVVVIAVGVGVVGVLLLYVMIVGRYVVHVGHLDIEDTRRQILMGSWQERPSRML